MKKNKKGFTLVELLAVIVILAIILAIAIPSVGNIMTAQRTSAFISNMKMIIHGIDLKVAQGTTLTACSDGPVTTDACNPSAYGGTNADYSVFNVTAVGGSNVTTITATGATGGKFDSCTVTEAQFTNLDTSGSDNGTVTLCK